MKEIVRSVLNIIISGWAKLYSNSTSILIHKRINQLYTMWISGEFAKIGRGAYITKPIYLHGGKHIKIGDNFFVIID